MTPYLVGAGLALVFAGYMFWQSKQSTGQVARLQLTETSTTADVRALFDAAREAAGAGSFEERVELVGRAVPGPRGPLTSEISKTECLWYRHKVTHKYRETYRNNEGHRRTRDREEVVSDHQTKDPFHLRDEHGEIALVPTARINGPRKTVSEFRPADGPQGSTISFGSFSFSMPGGGGDRTIGYEYEEWVLLPETRVFVSGEATDRGGELEVRGPRGEDKMLISTRSEDELIEEHRGDTRNAQLMAGLGAVGAVVLVVLAFVLG